MDASALEQIAATAGNSVASLFSISVTPILDTLAAVLLAFILGLSLSAMKGKEIGDTLYNAIKDFSTIIDKVLHVAIVPLLPLYICGTFVDMTHSGKTFVILGILWKVFLGSSPCTCCTWCSLLWWPEASATRIRSPC